MFANETSSSVSRRAVLAMGLSAATVAATAISATPAAAWTLTNPIQQDWRFCNRCFSLVRVNLDPMVGNACSAGGVHVVQGWKFHLPYTTSNIRHAGETSERQSAWMQCANCAVLYYDDFRGPCANSTYGHDFVRTVQYLMPHDINPQPAYTQAAWRFCFKCSSMYFDGYQPNRGVCPGNSGWGHAAAGYMFQIPVYSYT